MLRKMRLTMMTGAKSDAHDCNVPLQDYYEPGLIRLWDPKFSGKNSKFCKRKTIFCQRHAMHYECHEVCLFIIIFRQIAIMRWKSLEFHLFCKNLWVFLVTATTLLLLLFLQLGLPEAAGEQHDYRLGPQLGVLAFCLNCPDCPLPPFQSLLVTLRWGCLPPPHPPLTSISSCSW